MKSALFVLTSVLLSVTGAAPKAKADSGECKLHFRDKVSKKTKLLKTLRFSIDRSGKEIGSPGISTTVEDFNIWVLPATQFSIAISISNRKVFKGLFDVDSKNRYQQGFTGLLYVYDPLGKELQVICEKF